MAFTDLEHAANEEARHGNREALEAAHARIAELEGPDARLRLEREFDEARRIAWNAALEAAVDAVQENMFNLRSPDPDGGHVIYARDIIRALRRRRGNDE